MADISADSLLPSGSFNPSFFSGALTLAPGAPAGAIITLTPPAGKKVRLTGLVGAAETGITVNNGLSNVVSGLVLGSLIATTGQFAIGEGAGDGGGQGAGVLNYVESYSSITVTKSGGATAGSITYSYAYGD